MNLRKTFIMLIVVLFSIGVHATKVDLKREAMFPKSGARMPSITKVTADYDNRIITLNVTRYTGNVQVYVNDSQGNIVGYTLATISCNGTITLDIDPVTSGDYFLNIYLDNDAFYGQFYACI